MVMVPGFNDEPAFQFGLEAFGRQLDGLGLDLDRLVEIAAPVMHPPHAVEDSGTVGHQRIGLADQFESLLVARGFIGQGITERIQGLGMIRLLFENLAQVTLENADVTHLFTLQCAGVEQVIVKRELLECLVERGLEVG